MSLLKLSAIVLFAFVAYSKSGAQAGGQNTGASQTSDKTAADCGCESKGEPDVLAIVNGTKIQIKDVDESIKERVQQLQSQVTEARKRQLDMEINFRLLEAEAKRLGMTPVKLLERETGKAFKEPTEADARAFYEQNKSRIEGEYKDLKDQIIGYLRDQAKLEAGKKFAERLRAQAQVKVLAESATPPATDADLARVFATVNGKQVTSADVEEALKPLIFSVQDEVYALRKQALEMKINDLLLEEEAKKRNLTASALFDAEVLPKVKPVTEEIARKFYEENKGKVQGTFESLRSQIIQYLQNREQSNAAGAYAEQLRKGATVQTFLKPPDPPVFQISIADSPSKGAPNAPVTIIEFTDYECPSCGATQPVLEELVNEFAGKVKLVARNYPLDQHKRAKKAAEAAEAAREQGKYWEYAALLFKNQNALEVENLKGYASQLGLDRSRFDAALDSGKFADKVKQDITDGDKIGVNSTPTVFINGKRARDKSREGLKAAVEAALKDAKN